MKCWHCEARNLRTSSRCWACGIHLNRSRLRRGGDYRPEEMRHFSSASVAVEQHRSWLDGLILLSTVLFGILLGHFVANVLPGSLSTLPSVREQAGSALSASPLAFLLPQARALPLRPAGEAQSVNGVVTQVASIRNAPAEAGKAAGQGLQFVTATVVIDNQSAKPLAYKLGDWKARDSRGRTLTAQTINSAGWLSSGSVAPGQHVEGAVTFAVPVSESGLQITFSPPALGSLLRWDASAG